MKKKAVVNTISSRYLRSKIDMEDLLNHLRVDYTSGPKNLRFRCVNPDHNDTHPSMDLCYDGSSAHGSIHCFSCSMSGDFITLTQLVKEMDRDTAINYLVEVFLKGNIAEDDIYDLPMRLKSELKEEKKNINEVALPIGTNFIEKNDSYYKYLIKRKVLPEEIDEFDLLKCNSGKYIYYKEKNGELKRYATKVINSVVIPFYKGEELMAWISRSIDPSIPKKKRVLYPGQSKIREIVFPYNKIDFSLDYIHLCEGVFDYFSLARAGFKNVVANLGVAIPSDGPLDKASIYRKFKQIYVWKEGDVGGDALQKTVISKFAFDCRIFICSCPKDKDPGDLNIDQLKHIFDNRQNWFKRKKCKVVVSYLQ